MSFDGWLDRAITPCVPGVYQVRTEALPAPAFARWTGEHWCNCGVTLERAARCAWRGPDGYEWKEPPLIVDPAPTDWPEGVEMMLGAKS